MACVQLVSERLGENGMSPNKWKKLVTSTINSMGHRVERVEKTHHFLFYIRFSNGMLKKSWFGCSPKNTHINQIKRQIRAVERGEKYRG